MILLSGDGCRSLYARTTAALAARECALFCRQKGPSHREWWSIYKPGSVGVVLAPCFELLRLSGDM